MRDWAGMIRPRLASDLPPTPRDGERPDAIVLQKDDVDHYIDVPAELTPWQSFKIRLGGYAFALIILLIVCATIYFIIHTKLFKL